MNKISLFTPIIPFKRLREQDSLTPKQIAYFRNLYKEDPVVAYRQTSDNPIFSHAQTAFEILNLLDFHSLKEPELNGIAMCISHLCAEKGVFYQVDAEEDFTLISKKCAIKIYRCALRFFDPYFLSATCFEEGDSLKLKFYSRRSIELLKEFIYQRILPDTKESYKSLFDLLILAHQFSNQDLYHKVIEITCKKASETESVDEIFSLQKVFLKNPAEIRQGWWEVYISALNEVIDDKDFWENFSSLVDFLNIKEIEENDAFNEYINALADHIDSEDKLLLFHKIIEKREPTPKTCKSIFIALQSYFKRNNIDVLMYEFTQSKLPMIALPAQHLNLLYFDSKIKDMLLYYVKGIVIRYGNKFDIGQLEALATFSPTLFRQKIWIEYDPKKIDDPIKKVLKMALECTKSNITLLIKENKLFSSILYSRSSELSPSTITFISELYKENVDISKISCNIIKSDDILFSDFNVLGGPIESKEVQHFFSRILVNSRCRQIKIKQKELKEILVSQLLRKKLKYNLYNIRENYVICISRS